MSDKAFIFDIGNVLIDFNLLTLQENIVKASTAELPALQRDWNGRALDEVETGKVDTRQYFQAFSRRIGLSWDYEQWVEQWERIYTINRTGYDLFLSLRSRGHCVAMLSNLAPYNVTAIERKFPDFFAGGQRNFFSFDLGVRKPKPEIYRAACRSLEVSPSQCLFLDDSAENVAGARAAGLDAMQFVPEHYDDVVQRVESSR
jgi:glucose-1-phosphatase